MVPLATTGAKLACERLIDADPVPSTVPRATQFHELLAAALRLLSRGPVAPLPLDWRFQSVAAADVAARAAEIIDRDPLSRAADFGGPQVLGVRKDRQDLATASQRAAAQRAEPPLARRSPPGVRRRAAHHARARQRPPDLGRVRGRRVLTAPSAQQHAGIEAPRNGCAWLPPRPEPAG